MIEEERIVPYRSRFSTGDPVLVVAPHPDDETIGCGGSLIRHVEAGDPVRSVFLTRGDRGDFSGRYGKEYPALREAEAREAARLMGIRHLVFLPYKDRHVRADESLIRDLKQEITAFQARRIYAPSPMEAHPDHRQAARAVWEAAHRLPFATWIVFYETSVPLRPNLLVDISNQMARKMDVLGRYRSQFQDIDWRDRVKGMNRFRTITLLGQAEYAEAFWQERVHPSRAPAWEDLCRRMAGLPDPTSSPRGEPHRKTWGIQVPLCKGRLRLFYEKSAE